MVIFLKKQVGEIAYKWVLLYMIEWEALRKLVKMIF